MSFGIMICGLPLLILAILFLWGLYAIYYGARRYLIIQKIRNMPVSKAESAAMGLVNLEGKASSDKPMVSPVSGSRCVFWKVTGEYFLGRHEGDRWVRIYEQTSQGQFYVQDSTGRMRIDPKTAVLSDIPGLSTNEIDIPLSIQFEGIPSPDPTSTNRGVIDLSSPGADTRPISEASSFIASLPGEAKQGFTDHASHTIRIREWFIRDGEQLFVLGNVGAEGADRIIRKNGPKDLFYVSKGGEKQAYVKLRYGEVYWNLAVGFILASVSLLAIFLITGWFL